LRSVSGVLTGVARGNAKKHCAFFHNV
jgi:hypothetical protein